MRNTRALALCALICAIPTLTAMEARGGAAPLARLSTIHVEGVAKEDAYDEMSDTIEFGVFDDTVTGTAGDIGGTHATATATQRSHVDVSTLGRVSGLARNRIDVFAAFDPDDVEGPLATTAFSELIFDFQVTGPGSTYHVRGDIEGFPGTLELMLLDFGLPADVDPDVVFDVGGNDPASEGFERSGTLDPSTYRLIAGVKAGSSGSSPQDPHSFGTFSELNLAFEFGTAEAPVIPLPPAAWTGASGLLLAAGAVFVNRPRRLRLRPGEPGERHASHRHRRCLCRALRICRAEPRRGRRRCCAVAHVVRQRLRVRGGRIVRGHAQHRSVRSV